MISCHQVSKELGRNKVIEKFNYDFLEGKAYSIVGANGAGKTTLLKLLCGLLESDSGSIKRATRNGWYAFYSLSLMDRLTGKEQVSNRNFFLGNSEIDQRKISLWSKLEGFDEMMETELGHCSQGMKSLFGLFTSTLSGPDFLFWDEPFSYLSPYNQDILVKEWPSLTGAKTLLISHNGEDLKGFEKVELC